MNSRVYCCVGITSDNLKKCIGDIYDRNKKRGWCEVLELQNFLIYKSKLWMEIKVSCHPENYGYWNNTFMVKLGNNNSEIKNWKAFIKQRVEISNDVDSDYISVILDHLNEFYTHKQLSSKRFPNFFWDIIKKIIEQVNIKQLYPVSSIIRDFLIGEYPIYLSNTDLLR